MPLDDFLAKKEKKKAKKKQNPQSLIEKLTKEVEKSKKNDKEVVNDTTKQSMLENDEWENVDDDDDLDIPTVDISKLTLDRTDALGASVTVDKDNKESSADGTEAKKVWGTKSAVIEVPKPEPAPKQEPNSLYIPPSLMKTLQSTTNKPDVASSSDFPTLDAVVAETNTKKDDSKKAPGLSDHDIIEEGAASPWAQAGAPRRTPRVGTDSLPIAISSDPAPAALSTHNPSAYVPPFKRSTRDPIAEDDGQQQIRNGLSHSGDRQQQRFRDDLPGGGRKYDGFTPRESLRSTGGSVVSGGTAGGGSWSRGQTITTSAVNRSDEPVGDRPTATRLPQAAPTARYTPPCWSANLNVKTFKETNRDKTDFELTQTNRFAGFSET